MRVHALALARVCCDRLRALFFFKKKRVAQAIINGFKLHVALHKRTKRRQKAPQEGEERAA